MPRTSIPIQDVPFQKSAKISFVAADATNGMAFENAGDVILLVKNGGAGSINVTVTSVPDEAGRSGNLVQAVGAGDDAVFGPFRPAWWNQRNADLGEVYVNFSGAASVTVAALKLRP